MMKNATLFVALLTAGAVLSSCKGPATTTEPVTTAGPSTPASGSLADPKGSIAYQLALLKAGDMDTLKTCLTPRVRDSVTQEVVDKAKSDAAEAKFTIDDLYASAEMGEAGGTKTAKVKMKNGRTLTTLVETDGKWLADTIWFK